MPKVFTVEAQVHKEIANGYRVKALVTDIGLYINGMVVYPPAEKDGEWSVFSPAVRNGRGKYLRIVEFNMQLPLWHEIHDACIDAVKLERSYDRKAASQNISDVPNDQKKVDEAILNIPDDEDEPLDLDSIPF